MDTKRRHAQEGYLIGPFRVALCLNTKRVLVRNHSNENDIHLHENGRAGETHFHMNGFARRLVLKQRQHGNSLGNNLLPFDLAKVSDLNKIMKVDTEAPKNCKSKQREK